MKFTKFYTEEDYNLDSPFHSSNSTKGKNELIREIDGQIAIRIFGCSWRMSGCGAAYLSAPYGSGNSYDWGKDGFRHKACNDYEKQPRNEYWQTWFPRLHEQPDRVINRFTAIYKGSSVYVAKTKKDYIATVSYRKRTWTENGKTKGIAVCLAVLKALISIEQVQPRIK